MKLTPLLSDHAVVQRHQPIPVWGWTEQPHTRLQATLGTSRAEGISGAKGQGGRQVDPNHGPSKDLGTGTEVRFKEDLGARPGGLWKSIPVAGCNTTL